MKPVYKAIAIVSLVMFSAVNLPEKSLAQYRSSGFDDVRRQLTKVRPADGNDGEASRHGGVRVHGGIALGGGHDSNIDEATRGADAGGFGKVDAGIAVLAGPDSNRTSLLVRGSYARHDITSRPDRFVGGALLDHQVMIAPGLSLTLGGFYYRDEVDVDAMESQAGYFQVKRSDDYFQAFMRARVYRKHYLLDVANTMASFSLTDLDKSFDHVRYETSAGMMIGRKRRIAPYAEVGYGRLNYINERNPSVLTRDADEVWAIAGIRVNFSDTLHLDLGGRYNARWTDDRRGVGTFTSGFFDGRLVWEPGDSFSIELAIERKIVEPFETNAILTDQTSYIATVNLEPVNGLSISVEGGLLKLDEIGSTGRFNDLFVRIDLERELTRRIALYSSLFALRSHERTASETASRLRIEGGIKFTF